jgi:ABC-type transporter MlaC component
MVETITKGSEDPNSYIVQVQLVGPENKPFPMQYDMTVVKEDGKFKLSDSEVND